MKDPTVNKLDASLTGPESPHFLHEDASADTGGFEAWEEVAAGRFMPRRVRGSCQGRALG